MRGNSHVQFLGEGRSAMAVSYPTASLTSLRKEPRLMRGFFLGAPGMARCASAQPAWLW